MKMSNVHELLFRAAADSKDAFDYNDGLEAHMRISRAGFPLASLLLEDFIFSKLPVLPPKEKTVRQQNQSIVTQKMAQATGYLFEQVVADIFRDLPNVEVKTQHRVNTHGFNGSCDLIVVNEEKKRVTVVECKALKYSTKKEACTIALFNDESTSYLSQLSLYKVGVTQQYPGYETDAVWLVWCKGSASLFKVPYLDSGAIAEEKCTVAEEKKLLYCGFSSVFEAKDIDGCLSLLELNSLPLRAPYYSGFSASCPAHYSRWINLLLDEDGAVWEDAQDNLKLMLEVIFTKDEKAIDRLLQIL